MPKFTVYVHQYVEQVGSVEIEAEDLDSARDQAFAVGFEDVESWQEGDDCWGRVTPYALKDERGNVVELSN